MTCDSYSHRDRRWVVLVQKHQSVIVTVDSPSRNSHRVMMTSTLCDGRQLHSSSQPEQVLRQPRAASNVSLTAMCYSSDDSIEQWMRPKGPQARSIGCHFFPP